MSSVRWRRKKGMDGTLGARGRRTKERGRVVGEKIVTNSSGERGAGGKEGRKIDRERGERMRDVRDMAHLPLLSGCCEIAGFPRSAKCGSEFFPCLSPLHSLSSSSSVLHFLPHAHRLPPSLSLPRH